MGVKSVLIKGGHTLDGDNNESYAVDMNVTLGYAQDYFLSSVPHMGEERLCDGARGVWLCTARYDRSGPCLLAANIQLGCNAYTFCIAAYTLQLRFRAHSWHGMHSVFGHCIGSCLGPRTP